MSNGGESVSDTLLMGFSSADEGALFAALSRLGRSAKAGDPVNDPSPAIVLAAAYDESGLRSLRAAALDDDRPWGFCVPAAERNLVAAASAAREGRMLLLPPEERELKRLLSGLNEESKERRSGDATFSGLEDLEASFAWKTAAFDVSRVCRRLARLLAESGFYRDRSGEDECALALEEALVNSVEHGNLGLDSNLRPEDLTAEDRYEAEREKRLADPVYGERTIRISLGIRDDEARLVLTDQGEGFDTSKVEEQPTGLEVSGKGFWLIKRPFDGASYNGKGNQLTLVKRKPRA